MNIGVICNLNLARPPLITSFLRSEFPDDFFFSAGIKTSRFYEYPLSVRTISRNWSLPLNESPNRDLTCVSDLIGTADFLLCADDYVFSHCSIHLPDKKLVNLQSVGLENSLHVNDPLDEKDFLDFETVIAKYLLLSKKYLASFSYNDSKILFKVPKDIDDIKEKITEAFDEAGRLSQPLIIDYNLKVPNTKLVEIDTSKVSFMDELEFENLKSSSSVIYTFNKEFIYPERTYLDRDWRMKIHSLASTYDLILILPPSTLGVRSSPDSYLAALTS
jgi:hypothetical protein